MTESEDQIKRVEFYPSVDDYVYVAERIGNQVPPEQRVHYLFYAFLIINAIIFPVFLWFNEHLLAGFIVFLLNLLILLFVAPRANSDAFRRHYEFILRNCLDEVVTVEISSTGIRYSSDGADAFWSWSRIRSIEDAERTIYFFSDENGIAVRKEGFAYEQDTRKFLDLARKSLAEFRSQQQISS